MLSDLQKAYLATGPDEVQAVLMAAGMGKLALNMQNLPHVEFATSEESDTAEAIHCGDDINIDYPARVSRADDGYWVEAWVWVDRPSDEDEEEAPSA